MTMRRLFVVVLVLCLAIGAASAVEIREDFQESFDVTPGTVLELHHGDGDVTLTPWDQNRIDLHIVYEADITKVGFGAKPDFDVKFRQSDDRLLVKEEVKGGTTFGFYSRNQVTYTYEIKAPAWIDLELHGDDGDLGITGWKGDMELVLDDGDLDLSDIIAGEIGINLDDGNVDGRNIDAALKIISDDGDIRVTGLTGPALVLATDDGDIDIGFAGTGSERIEATSDDGDIRLRFPAPVSFGYDIRTDDGRIRLDLSGAGGGPQESSDGGEVVGTVGGGGGQVKIRTDDGNVELIAE